jgi:DNA-binding NarL/FixJ family response regulator
MLLVAPAGYGKTTLARQWLSGRASAWYQASPASSDVAALALGIAKASGEIIPDAGEQLRGRLRTIGDPAAEAQNLAVDLGADFGDWPVGARLVIDDYQLIAESPAAEDFIAAFVEATAVPLLITSRTRPAWVTAKKLLYGDVIEFGRNVLAMTHNEAAEALASGHKEMLGLVALAEGWPAVIGLAALLPYPLQEEASDVPETLHEYFAEELYHTVVEDERWIAAQLSIAPTIDDTVGRSLYGQQRAEVLEGAFRSGFLSKAGTVYEMHPLIRQFLQMKLQEFDTNDVRKTANLVATGYANDGRWDEAASVATDFGLTDVLLSVLTAALEAVLSEGRFTTFNRWHEAARAMAPTAPIVRLAAIEVAFRTGDWMAASGRAAQLARSIPEDEPLASRVYLRAGQVAHLEDRQEDALELLTAAKTEARTPRDLRNALWSRFLTLCDLDERDEAQAALQEVEELPPLNSEDLLRANQGRLQFAVRWGPMIETLDAISAVADLVDESTDPLVRTGFLQTYGSALALVGRYEASHEIAQRQLAEAETYKLEWVLPHALEMLAIAQTGQRQFEGAIKSLTHARKLAKEQGNVHTQVNGLALTARVHLCRGSAERAVEVLESRDIRFTSPGMEGDYLATHAFALACCKRTTDALKLVEASESVSSHIDSRALRDFARAVASHFDGQPEEVDRRARAFRTIGETGNFDAFVCAYRAFPSLLAGLTDLDEVARRPFTDLISSLDPGLAEKAGLRFPARASKESEPLTPREREVLSLVRQGLSNRQIAKTLWISESTVKVHVHHVLAKMGVHSRTEAATLPPQET